jgi:hypothetical protein
MKKKKGLRQTTRGKKEGSKRSKKKESNKTKKHRFEILAVINAVIRPI